MKKLLIFFVFIGGLNAQILNGIVAIVENEPITLNEVDVVSNELKVDQNTALEFLIKDKLKDAQIKALNITATNYEIEQRISQIAAQNGVGLEDFKSILASKGVDFNKFTKQTSDAIKQEKLYSSVFYSMRQNINENDALIYYNANKNLFTIFESIDLVKYSCADKNLLQNLRDSFAKSQKGVKIENISMNISQLNQKQIYLFQNTKSGEFTPILPQDNGFEMYFIKSKNGTKIVEFPKVKNQILNQMLEIEQRNAINEYFDKLRSKANIQLLR